MKQKIKIILLTILRFAPLIVCAVFMCIYLFSGEDITAESLLNFAPEEPLYAALFLIMLFMSFFLRVISCLPGDTISMYFGASKMPFWTCLLGSFLGTLPGMVASTLLGMSITDPSSPMF